MKSYSGYKMIDTVALYCQATQKDNGCYKAYLVDPANKGQVSSATSWATITEYGNYDKQTGTYPNKKIIDPLIFTFENKGFKFSLFDSAKGSSQGGKLSFWNCIVEKEGTRFQIGIASDLLLDLLMEGSLVKGELKEPVCFATRNGSVGVVVEGGPSYTKASEDMKLKKSISKGSTVKYERGDIVRTTTMTEVFLGEAYKYYSFESHYERYYHRLQEFKPKLSKLVIHKNPLKVFAYNGSKNNLSEVSPWPDYVAKKRSRALTGEKIVQDMSFEQYWENVHNKWNTYADTCTCTGYGPEQREIYNFLSVVENRMFGYNVKPFALDPKILEIAMKIGVQIIEE